MLFPLYDRGWALLIVNLREKKVSLLHPCGQPRRVEERLVRLFEFLKEEVSIHERRRIEDSPWRNLQYENEALAERCSEADSGLIVLKIAECLATGKPGRPAVRQTEQYRGEFLKLLFLNRSVI